MSQTRTAPFRYACRNCGWRSATFKPQCGACDAWDTLDSITPTRSAGDAYAGVVRCTAASLPPVKRLPSGLEWFDDALNGGLAVPQRLLLGGGEGAGKSRLCLQLARGWAEKRSVLYVCGEMAIQQVREMARQLDALHRNILLTAAVQLPAVLDVIRRVKPAVVIVDSLNSLHDPARRGDPGSPTQQKACLSALGGLCVQTRTPSVFLAHLNGQDAVAGPRWLRHEVDAVAMLQLEKNGNGRTFKVRKNRSGPNSEVKLRMGEKGLVA